MRSVGSAIDKARLFLLLTRSLCRGDPLRTLEACLEGGVDLVQIREKPFGEGALAWIRLVRREAGGVPVIVNDRIDLCRAGGALGVHLGREDLVAHAPGSLRDRDFVLGLSIHDPADLRRAMQEEPDYVGIGPCAPTATRAYDQGLPPRRIRALLRSCPVPAFGIGGITADTLPPLLDLGLRRIAVSSFLLGARDPREAARSLRDLLEAHPLP